MHTHRSLFWIAAAPAVLLAALAVLAIAGPVGPLTTFTPGTVADANQVNANFTAVASAVNDNHARISTIETGSPVAGLDADRLDNLHANSLVRASYTENLGFIDDYDSTTPDPTLLSNSVNAPVNGVLLIWGCVDAEWDASSGAGNPSDFRIWLQVDGSQVSAVMEAQYHDGVPIFDEKCLSVAAAAAVTAGAHTVEIEGDESGAGMTFVKDRSLTTLFVPFGNAGTQGSLKPVLAGLIENLPSDQQEAD